MSDDIALGGVLYARDDNGEWYDMEPGDDEELWVGPLLDDPQLCAALDEIERLVTAIWEACRIMGDDVTDGPPTSPPLHELLVSRAVEWRRDEDEAADEYATTLKLVERLRTENQQLRLHPSPEDTP